MNDSVEQGPEEDITEETARDAFGKDIERFTEVKPGLALGLEDKDQYGEEGRSEQVEDKAREVCKSQGSCGQAKDGRVGGANKVHCLGVLGDEHVDVEGVVWVDLC